MEVFNSQDQKILIETIFQQIPQLIFWKNTESVYLGCNQRYAELIGLNRPEEILGKTDYEIGWLPDGDTADKFRAGDQETLTGQHLTNAEEWLSLKNGTKILTLINKVPLIDPQGVVFGVLGVATDITEKKRIEDSLTQLKGMALISASLAHELRTPLAALKSAVKGIRALMPALLAGYEAAKIHHLAIPSIPASRLKLLTQVLDTLENKVDQSQNIIDMTLTNIRSSHATKLAPSKKCSARHCINQALAQYIFPLNGKPKIIWNDAQDFTFYGQEILLIHVLFNLLKNAIYFINKTGKGHIHIWLEQSKNYNTLHFKDTSQGIEEKNLPHIFDLFFTSGTNKGTGVGLAFCQLTLQALNGSITCESRWQEYTEFILKFPKKNPSTKEA
ncbi:MAG TPA: PAS domain-containing sensor histidine kinase [Gammaproteobacteria bacterium]|nr:PAS domain-containing sensor histidine kinase [Gammaproteobacteria bacterium]